MKVVTNFLHNLLVETGCSFFVRRNYSFSLKGGKLAKNVWYISRANRFVKVSSSWMFASSFGVEKFHHYSLSYIYTVWLNESPSKSRLPWWGNVMTGFTWTNVFSPFLFPEQFFYDGFVSMKLCLSSVNCFNLEITNCQLTNMFNVSVGHILVWCIP